MRTVRVYSEQPLAAGTTVELAADAARHVSKVLRMRVGDGLIIFDGSGRDYPAVITAIDKRRVAAETGEAQQSNSESSLHITLWHGVCRGSRMDYVVQKATELGVAAIQPVVTERGVVKFNEQRAENKVMHWRKVASSAAEQSGRSLLPEIYPPRTLLECLSTAADDSTRVILHPLGQTGLASLVSGQAALTLLTGPEGGFTDNECAAATAAGFVMATLGPRILRSETAPVAALAIAQSVAGDLNSGVGE